MLFTFFRFFNIKVFQTGRTKAWQIVWDALSQSYEEGTVNTTLLAQTGSHSEGCGFLLASDFSAHSSQLSVRAGWKHLRVPTPPPPSRFLCLAFFVTYTFH